MTRKKVISVRLTETEYDNLAKLAELRGVKVSDVIRQIINCRCSRMYRPPKSPYIPDTSTTSGDVKYFVWNGGMTNA